jgi:hypothetical protein
MGSSQGSVSITVSFIATHLLVMALTEADVILATELLSKQLFCCMQQNFALHYTTTTFCMKFGINHYYMITVWVGADDYMNDMGVFS